MSVSKKYLKSKPVCKVTFKLSKTAANGAKKVWLVGEFNEWNTQKTPMKAAKDGSFVVMVELEPGREYQFRYLTEDGVWLNDTRADRYAYSAFACGDNSVVSI